MSLPQKDFRKSENSNNRANNVLHFSSDPSMSFGNPCSSSQAQKPIGSAFAPSTTVPRNNPVPVPPPVPPRLQTTTISSYRSGPPPLSYSSYVPYGRYPVTNAYSTYGSYGALGCGVPRYGYPHGYPQSFGEMGDAESAFLRMAEESSRPAFQSIESLVTAVGSISMMLESTYHAVYNSYRAVLGVVESFSRLRNHLAHVLSTLALLRTFQWLIQRVLYYLRIRKTSPSVEAAWSAATAVTANSVPGEPAPHSSWPIVLFLGVVFGAPWLIFRIFSKLALKKQIGKSGTDGEIYYAVSLYDFRAMHQGELSIKPGQQLTVAPKSQQPRVKGWTLVYVDNHTAGLVPSNYIRIYRKKIVQQPVPTHPTNMTGSEMDDLFGTVSEGATETEVNPDS